MEQIIDTALGQGCKDFNSFLSAMKAAGVEVKRGKHLTFKISNGKAKIFNLKEMAKTLIYLPENNLTDLEEMMELLTAQNNVERILGVTENEKNRSSQQGAR